MRGLGLRVSGFVKQEPSPNRGAGYAVRSAMLANYRTSKRQGALFLMGTMHMTKHIDI